MHTVGKAVFSPGDLIASPDMIGKELLKLAVSNDEMHKEVTKLAKRCVVL